MMRAISRLERPCSKCSRRTSWILRMDNLLLVKQPSGKYREVATVIPLPPAHSGRVKLSSLARNQCPVCGGMGVQFGAENALMLRMMLAFGLRRKEVVHNRPWKADRGDKLSIYPGEAKGGRPRDIIFNTPEQRIVLDYVKSHVNKNESLGWTTNTRGEKATLQFNIGKYNRLMAKIGITKLKDGATVHGLRAQYAENSALIAGMIPATLGGTKGQMDKESLDVTRAQISEQLGHSRIDVTASYYGSFGRNAKPDEVNRCKTNIEGGLRATATMQLKPVPPERMVDCLQMIGELDAIDVGATPSRSTSFGRRTAPGSQVSGYLLRRVT